MIARKMDNNFQNKQCANWSHDAVVTKADELIMAQKSDMQHIWSS
jgi:hypothetical protein